MPGDDKVVFLTHSLCGFANFRFVISDYFNALELHAQQEAVLGEVGGVRVNRLRKLCQQCAT